MHDFGKTLRKLRTENKMTQTELGKKLGVSEAAISKYESNKVRPSFDSMRTIAIIFSVSMDYLYGIEEFVSNNTVSLNGLNETQSTYIREYINECIRHRNS